MKSAILSALIFCSWASFAFVARCHNLSGVFVDGHIYFADGDCYSRMTRSRMVDEHFGTIVRHQDFENYPEGTDSHATAPMDYLIVATKWFVSGILRVVDPGRTSILESQALDVAGALVSPLLGALTCGFLALFARGLPLSKGARWTVPFYWAVSPILVWGTILGRPDHQSLQMALLAVALAAECRLATGLTRAWAVASGAAWALGLWVSLYEPAVLFGLVMLCWACLKPRALVAPERRPGWIVFAAVLGVALAVEGWPVELPNQKMSQYLVNWAGTIGELHHLDLRGPTLYSWLGAACVVSPVLLVLASRRDRRALPGLILLLATLALTWWQVRWAYFMALVFVLTLPWQFTVLRRWWSVGLVAILALWPTFRMESVQVRLLYVLAAVFLLTLPWRPLPRWRVPLVMLRWSAFSSLVCFLLSFGLEANDRLAWEIFFGMVLFSGTFLLLRPRRWLLFERFSIVGSLVCLSLIPTVVEWRANFSPNPQKLAEANLEKRLLRETAENLRGPEKAGFLAPWWLSPALAYWSGQPAVSGTSHEAIAGNVDSARFYLAATIEEAAAILRLRRVSRVIADDPTREIETSSTIIGVVVEPSRCMATTLYNPGHKLPRYLLPTFSNEYFKVFAVDQAKLEP